MFGYEYLKYLIFFGLLSIPSKMFTAGCGDETKSKNTFVQSVVLCIFEVHIVVFYYALI